MCGHESANAEEAQDGDESRLLKISNSLREKNPRVMGLCFVDFYFILFFKDDEKQFRQKTCIPQQKLGLVTFTGQPVLVPILSLSEKFFQ